MIVTLDPYTYYGKSLPSVIRIPGGIIIFYDHRLQAAINDKVREMQTKKDQAYNVNIFRTGNIGEKPEFKILPSVVTLNEILDILFKIHPSCIPSNALLDKIEDIPKFDIFEIEICDNFKPPGKKHWNSEYTYLGIQRRKDKFRIYKLKK